MKAEFFLSLQAKIHTMSRKKLERFAHNQQSPYIIEAGKPFYEHCKGRWLQEYFHNEQPIVLELACGRGEYTTGLAAEHPHKNFIGVDIKGARIWKGSSVAEAQDLQNVAFLRAYIQNLEQFFAPQEVQDIWLIHPDPRPRSKDEKRRLTHPRFLEMYRRLMQPQGTLHFKTDNAGLFEYSMEVLAQSPIQNLAWTDNLQESPLLAEHFGIRTKYELAFEAKGSKIHYLRFQFLP